jgi:hypothetical protein
MVGTLITVLLVILGGARAGDALRLRQQEVVLSKLARGDAVAFYDVLRRRARNARILRGVSLVALVCLVYVWRHRLTGQGPL